jgi:hypothetical protein
MQGARLQGHAGHGRACTVLRHATLHCFIATHTDMQLVVERSVTTGTRRSMPRFDGVEHG